ncbi:MAG: hypothetical protein AAF141_02790 [Pseudomonadota bacterium]
MSFQLGASAPSPVKPVVDSANVVIAWVTLTSTEISLVEQSTANRVNTLGNVDARLKDTEEWRVQTQPTVDGLRSDVSKLAVSAAGKTDRTAIAAIMEQLARLNEQVGVDPAASFSYTDYFLDAEDSDTDHIEYVAKVEEGLRFADDANERSAIAVETPGDTRFQIHPNGLLMPAHQEHAALSVVGRDSEQALSNAGSQTVEYKLKTVSRTRIRYGTPFVVCTNAQWWSTGRYNETTGIYTNRAGEQFDVEYIRAHPTNDPNRQITRFRRIWTDTYEEPYWDAITVPASYVGNVASNTFQMPASGFVTGINLGFSRVDSGGDVRLVLCETLNDGSPNYQAAIADVTVEAADLKTYPELTRFDVGPTLLDGGKRYAWAVITSGNHWLAMVEGNRYSQGTFFLSTDGVWSQGNLALDACFEVITAEFDVPRMVINLQDFTLGGGIVGIDLDLEQLVPDGTSITYEVRIDNVWTPLEFVGDDNHPLTGLPANLNARVVLLGTTQLMPAIKMNGSFVTTTRPRIDGTHISEPRLAPANVDEITAVVTLEHFDEANHDCVASILVGAGFATEVAPSSFSDKVLPDGTIRRTFVYAGVTPTDQWKRKIEINTVSALSVFHVAETTEYSFAA